jgi:prepilin-type N-terminal cleavage/methylation domain-containing protein
MKSSRPSGFTLVELLITCAIISTLAIIGIAAFKGLRKKSQMVTEINAARNLITAFLDHATENGGRVLAGYRQDDTVTNLDGETLHFPINARYPWRLTGNLPQIEGVMLYNGNEQALKSSNRDYLVSVQPNMGLNAVMVGGYFGTGSPLQPTQRMIDTLGKFHLTHVAESQNPHRLIVFSSARSGENKRGYFEVRPPNLTKQVWSSREFSAKSAAADHGFVDMRWGDKAVVACLAGNVELLDEKQLRDMTRWSIQADAAGDPSYILRPLPK